MSLLSFITAVVAAKLLPANSDVETTKRIAELEHENKELQARLDSVLRDITDQRVYLFAEMQRQYSQMQAAQLYQQQALCLQGAQQDFNPSYQGLCNCVPSRAQVWAVRDTLDG